MTYTIGVDIGGTFTDCVAVSSDGQVIHGKALSTHATNPTEGVLAGIEQLADATGRSVADLLRATTTFSHGTTIGTNLVVERKGARVGLVATAGHGDALSMMRGRGRTAGEPVDRVLNVRDTDKPRPIVPRRDVVEVKERVAVDGGVLVALDEAHARDAIASLVNSGIDALAICLLWSFRNPTHERRLREIALELAPDLYVSISSEVAPRQGEYERTVATVINSYIGPASSGYLEKLEKTLAADGLSSRPFIMQAAGGVIPIDVAARQPVQTIGSGPAGGLAGTVDIARRAGHSHVIATDMGGTSFEVGLIIDGRPVLTSESIVDKYTYTLPHLDLQSIACGGGSIARIDARSGGLQVGPDSAGSWPGPACYGTGTEATVTDADVVLGLIDPDQFLGGSMKLDRSASERAVGALAEQTGLSLEEAAAGILRVNGNNAATLIRQRTIQQGLDPREFALYAFGGAGPVHAFSFAEELGITDVVIPMGNGASTLSAYGIASSEAMQVFEQECVIHAPFDATQLAHLTTALEAKAMGQMRDAGFAPEQVVLQRTALARYAGQFMQEIPLPMEAGDAFEDHARALDGAFVQEYARLYGEAALSPFHVPEIFTIRIMATATVGEGVAPLTDTRGERREPVRHRQVYWPAEEQWTTTAVYEGPPPPGDLISGPAVVQLPHTTISVAPGQRLTTDAHGSCVLLLKEGRA